MWINIPVPWIPWVLLIVNGNYALDFFTDLVPVFFHQVNHFKPHWWDAFSETSLFTIPFRGLKEKKGPPPDS